MTLTKRKKESIKNIIILKNKISPSSFIFLIFKLIAPLGIYKFQTRCFEDALFILKKNIGDIELAKLMGEMDFYYRNGRYFSDEIDVSFTELQNSKIIAFINPKFHGFIYLGNKERKNRSQRAKYISRILLRQLKKEYDFADNINVKQLLKLSTMFLKYYKEEIEKIGNNEESKDKYREFVSHWNKRIT